MPLLVHRNILTAALSSASGEDRGVVTLVACSDGAGLGWLYIYRQAR